MADYNPDRLTLGMLVQDLINLYGHMYTSMMQYLMSLVAKLRVNS